MSSDDDQRARRRADGSEQGERRRLLERDDEEEQARDERHHQVEEPEDDGEAGPHAADAGRAVDRLLAGQRLDPVDLGGDALRHLVRRGARRPPARR